MKCALCIIACLIPPALRFVSLCSIIRACPNARPRLNVSSVVDAIHTRLAFFSMAYWDDDTNRSIGQLSDL